MSERIQVIFCTDGVFPYAVGGMQRHSKLLIEALLKTEAVELIVLHPHQEEVFPPHPLLKEVKITPIDPQKNYLKETYKYSARVDDILNRYPNYLIYAQGLTVWKNVKKHEHRLIVNPHGLEPYQALSYKDQLIAIPFKRVFNKIFRHANKVVSLGGRLTDILNKTPAKNKIVVLPNATNLPESDFEEKTFGNHSMTCFFLSRFASNKGIHILFEAIEKLNQEGYSDEINFVLGGKGPLWDHYNEKNTYPNVKLLGFVEDGELPQIFKSSDVFVFPTLFEGMPTVILEAMSYGLPIIASDVGAVAELVDDSNGFLIPKNKVDSLVTAIKTFYGLDNTVKKNQSLNSYNRCLNQFTWSSVANQHLELFKKLK